jgi:quercetin dioxygenase-like cupin family protein
MSYTSIPNLTSQIEIPEEGILSRVLFKDDQVRVVGFGFDTGQELSEHTAAVPAILQVVSGRMTGTLGSDVIDLEPGSWVHMPADLAHSVRALEPSLLLLTLLQHR